MSTTKPDRRPAAWALLALAAVLPLVPAHGEPPAEEPDAREAVGIFPIDDETLLVVKEIPGTLFLATRKAREVRFVSRATDKSGSERPIGVWFQGTTVVLAPAPGAAMPDGILRVEVPDGFAVRVEPIGGTANLDDLSGRVEVRAKNTDVRCRAITGTLEIAAEGGSVRVSEVAGATIRAKDTKVEATQVRGTLVARLEGASKLNASQVNGELDVESDDTAITAQGISGMVRLKARGGSADLKGLDAGADLRLEGCSLKLQDGNGDFTVSSDAAITFEKMTAALHFDLYGGTLRGGGNQGLVEVRTRNTEIALEGIDGPLRIQGDGLKVHASGVSGDVYVEAAISDVTIEKAGAAVGLKIEQGPVTLHGAAGLVSATVTNADARLLELTGPVALEIDGGNAEVSWTSITGETNTLLKSGRGDITVTFPPNASCRVEARSKFGRVESDLPTVRVLEDAKEAQGPIGHGRQPTIKVEADGDIRLLGGTGEAPPPQE